MVITGVFQWNIFYNMSKVKMYIPRQTLLRGSPRQQAATFDKGPHGD